MRINHASNDCLNYVLSIVGVFIILIRPPPRATLTDILFPDTTLSRSLARGNHKHARPAAHPSRIEARDRPPPPASRRAAAAGSPAWRSEEHTSELQSLMRISYSVFCLKKKLPTNR